MGHEPEKSFPTNSKDYQLCEEVGEGVSATVYRALCIPLNEVVAIKVLDLERCNNDLDGIRREVQTMRLIDHPNVVKAYCSFPAGHQLWVVMPYMAGGSCLHIMKFAHPEGFEEPVIATLLREVLKALVYVHGEGHIHRDVKAGNILIDANGAVKLADFGVAACMFDTGDRQRARNTFVGTPCWMAPEVMQQLHGYDFKADIWSFGITALELAHGHAPFSKYPPMKVLLMTLQNAPPGLDYERDKKFSKSFKEMVATCLVKDPKKRPTSEKLLKHHFFKHARSNEYLARAILDGLPPLADRFRALKVREGDILLNKADDDKEQLSQREYIRGISAWNFNLEDLKSQAALIQEESPNLGELDMNRGTDYADDTSEPVDSAQQIASHETDDIANDVTSRKEALQDLQDFDGLLGTAFPIRPLKALEGYFDVSEDGIKDASPNGQVAVQSDSESLNFMHQRLHEVDMENENSAGKNLEHVLSHARSTALPTERDELHKKHDCERNYSGPLLNHYSPNHSSVNLNGESSEGRVFQRKGRFQVTSSDVGNKVASLVSPIGGLTASTTLEAASILPTLQFILQQNVIQREQIVKLLKLVEQASGHHLERSSFSGGEPSLTATKERELQSYILQLQQQIDNLADELQRIKYKNALLERKLYSFQGEMIIKENDIPEGE